MAVGLTIMAQYQFHGNYQRRAKVPEETKFYAFQQKIAININYLVKNLNILMHDYPVYRPEKYSALGLILSDSTYTYPGYKPQPVPTSQIYQLSSPTFRSRARSRQSSPRNVTPPHSVSKIQERIREDLIKGESRIQYVPVEKKVVDYVDEPRYSLVPRRRTVTDYKEIVKVDIVPREVTSTDYYAVQHIRRYIPQIIPEHYTEYVPVERKNIKYEYIPVERQILHFPKASQEEQQSRYLGVRQQAGQKVYENLQEADIKYWEKQYGYVRGEPISVLNKKIRDKIEQEKELYFKQFQSKSTVVTSRHAENSQKF